MLEEGNLPTSLPGTQVCGTANYDIPIIPRLLLLCGESRSPFFHLRRSDVFYVCCQHPFVSKWVCQFAETVSPEHVLHRHGFFCTRFDGLFECSVNILNI